MMIYLLELLRKYFDSSGNLIIKQELILLYEIPFCQEHRYFLHNKKLKKGAWPLFYLNINQTLFIIINFSGSL